MRELIYRVVQMLLDTEGNSFIECYLLTEYKVVQI
jgi:hypothetical protein